MHIRTLGLSILFTVAASAVSLHAQTPADSALTACIEGAEAKDRNAARTAADRADELFQARLKSNPADVDARVGLASVISRCRIPFANMMAAGGLVGRSNELLEEALRLDARHWQGRFMLAMNHYHTPAFLGRTDDAIRHFETLLAQQGERADESRFALTYAFLGDLYQRTRRPAEALTLWRRGQALFPSSQALSRRIEEAAQPGK